MKVYLKNIKIDRGCFSSEKAVIYTDYNDKVMSGFFGDDYIKDGGLEVSVIDMEEDWAFVTPKGGYFLEYDSGIGVRVSDLYNEKGELISTKSLDGSVK